MPDLTVITLAHCPTAESWEVQVPKSKGVGFYTVTFGIIPGEGYDYSCTCEGYKWRKKCRHIEEAKLLHCGWTEETGTGSPTKDGRCPKCGTPVLHHRATV